MRAITISLPDALVHRVKIIAEERDTSVSSLVQEALESLFSVKNVEADYYTEWAAEEELMELGTGLRIGNMHGCRDRLHDR